MSRSYRHDRFSDSREACRQIKAYREKIAKKQAKRAREASRFGIEQMVDQMIDAQERGKVNG